MGSNLGLNAGHAPGSGAGPASGGTSPVSRGATDVFGYDDYRAYMRDRFADLQARKQTFSQRGLARKARIANPGFFNEVIRGRRRLSPAAAAKMAYGLELSPLETEYFSALVDCTEARGTAARLRARKRMMDLKNRRLCHALNEIHTPAETLRQIIQELEGAWVLQAAQVGREPVLDPMGESTLSLILKRLVDLRTQKESTRQAVHFILLAAPRKAAPLS